MERYDVAVIGAGPAGAATAIVLRAAGFSVALIERRQHGEVRIGETLPPAARVPLAQLGVWEAFRADGHAESPGTLAAWGQEALHENHFVANPYGNGWHVDRARFDALLVRAAREAGARVAGGTSVTGCRLEGAVWRVASTSTLNGCESVQARFVVDATGRVSRLTRANGIGRTEYDRLVGLVRFYPPRDEVRGDFRTIVEAAPDGWWYSALLPGRKLVVAYMTDADSLPRGQETRVRDWQCRLMQTTYTRWRIGEARVAGELKILSANSSWPETIVGPNWLAVGDAGMAFDPLSSQGIHRALESGIRAGNAIGEWLTGDSAALSGYAAWMSARFVSYLRQRDSYYAREQRWPTRPFWRRRSGGPVARHARARSRQAIEQVVHEAGAR